MLRLALRTAEFLFYEGLLRVVDRVSALPRTTELPDAMRLYRENLALKAQLEALHQAALRRGDSPRVPLNVRAAQVFAYLLTRGDQPFQRYFLSAPIPTIQRWATRFRTGRHRNANAGGRPVVTKYLVDMIVTLKRENPAWGHTRIRQELRRMGLRASEPTIKHVLEQHGLEPDGRRRGPFEPIHAAAKDAIWAVDFFAVRAARNTWYQVLLAIDLHTREILDLRVHEGWDVDSAWTARTLAGILARTKRMPKRVLHDHGTHFRGQFERALRVLGIDDEMTPVHVPQANCYAERAIGSVRRELLRHVRVSSAEELQLYLDEYRAYATTERAHQGLGGRTPADVANEASEPALLTIDEARSRILRRRSYARGLLHGYSLERGEEVPLAA